MTAFIIGQILGYILIGAIIVKTGLFIRNRLRKKE